MASKPYDSKRWLYEKYWKEDLTKGEVADEAGVNRVTIRRKMDAFGVPSRPGRCRVDNYIGWMRGREWLYEEYWRKERDTVEIANGWGFTHVFVQKLMERLGVPLRPANSNTNAYILRMRPREWLFNEYWRKGKSTVQIAKENGVAPGHVSWVMENHDPPIKRSQKFTGSGYRSSSARLIPSRRVGARGYVTMNVSMGKDDYTKVAEHRLTAIAEWGLDAIKGNHVHHANGIPWLNVPEFDMDIPELENPNLVPMDPITHAKIPPQS